MEISELCHSLSLNEEQCNLLKELFPKVCVCVNGRRKRKPSQYNLYIKDCVPEKRKEGMVVQQAFSACAKEYSEGKRVE